MSSMASTPPPMVLTVRQGIKEGATKEKVEAAWKHVSEAAAKVPGFQRFQPAWTEDGKTALVTELFDEPANYPAFMGGVDMSIVGAAIDFKEARLQCTKAQAEGIPAEIIKMM